jgi:hypothetical protein
MSEDELKLALKHAKRDERHLSNAETRYWCDQYKLLATQAIEAVAQPEQEPAACKECHLKDTVYDLLGDLKVANLKLSVRGKRTWVEVTDEEREQVINANTSTGLWHMAKDIEAKLKEKNFD